MSYIDLHAHVLPGVDDGAETLEASLMMLRMASEHGTKALAVTPHGAWVTKTRYLGKFERLKAAAARESLPVKLFFGMEMMADGTLFDRLQSGDVLYTGDTLFRMSRGRTDFPGGSDAQMLESFRKLKALDGDFRVLPGHNEESTLSFEKEHNPTMRGL